MDNGLGAESLIQLGGPELLHVPWRQVCEGHAAERGDDVVADTRGVVNPRRAADVGPNRRQPLFQVSVQPLSRVGSRETLVLGTEGGRQPLLHLATSPAVEG